MTSGPDCRRDAPTSIGQTHSYRSGMAEICPILVLTGKYCDMCEPNLKVCLSRISSIIIIYASHSHVGGRQPSQW